MMMKRLLIVALLLSLVATPLVALASISGARYFGIIQISNNSTATTNVATTANISTANLIAGGYLNASANNCVMRTSSGADVPFMPSVNASYPWCIWVDSITTDGYLSYILYTAESSGGKIRYFPSSGNTTVSDNETLELLGDFVIEVSGYFNTATGADKNILYKDSAIKLFVSPTVADNITATITGGNSLRALNVVSGEHDIVITANVTHWWIEVDTILKDTQVLSANVTDNGNQWIMFENNVMPYVEYIKIWVR